MDNEEIKYPQNDDLLDELYLSDDGEMDEEDSEDEELDLEDEE